jgi:Ser/Thr protein kinase RdoA (MazF antagonist)
VIDRGLPHVPDLLDAGVMSGVLARSLGRPASVGRPAIARVVYKPGRRLAVHYELRVDGKPADAVALARADADLAHRVQTPRYADLAARLAGRTPAATPATYASDVGALVTWLPFDLGLPVLAEPPEVLAWRLRTAGVPVEDPPGEPARVGYKPGRRVALRFGEHFLKAYHARTQYDAAVAGLLAAERSHAVPTPRFESALDDVRLTAQETVADGRPIEALAAAARAGALARDLHRMPADGLALAPPAHELEAAGRKAGLIAYVVPGCAARVHALMGRLEASAPVDAPLVAAHGDFHAGQLIEHAGELLVTDLDAVCAAPAALDLAEYAAGVVAGDDGDLERVSAALDGLLAGYGARPPALTWYLAVAVLIRASHPFHRQVPAWPVRVGAMLDTAEAILEA